VISQKQRPLPDNTPHSQRQNPCPRQGFEPAIPTGEPPQTPTWTARPPGSAKNLKPRGQNCVPNINDSVTVISDLISWNSGLIYIRSNLFAKSHVHFLEAAANTGFLPENMQYIYLVTLIYRLLVPAAKLRKAWVCGRPPAEVVGSNPIEMLVRCECCVLLGRGLCEELITRPDESCRLWCFVECDLETP